MPISAPISRNFSLVPTTIASSTLTTIININHKNLSNISNSTVILPSSSPASCTLNTESGAIVFMILFPIIFVFSLLGNVLVIVTVVRNRFMHTVTNLFLINLAVSDLLLTFICMPPTYTGYMFSCFFYGRFLCPVISYMQPLSVAACANTLVAIALERYKAICKPLQSQHWKTKSHALMMIGCVWVISSLYTVPSAIYVELYEYEHGKLNCRNTFSVRGQQIYYAFITLSCFGVPLLAMVALYSMVIHTLWKGIQMDEFGQISAAAIRPSQAGWLRRSLRRTFSRRRPQLQYQNSGRKRKNSLASSSSEEEKKPGGEDNHQNQQSSYVAAEKRSVSIVDDPKTRKTKVPNVGPKDGKFSKLSSCTPNTTVALRSTHGERSLATKKRVIRMLIMIVIEFFTCWTPLYVYFTLASMGKLNVRVLHLFFLVLAYLSLLTNPVTYCFLNAKFRTAMLRAVGLGCLTTRKRPGRGDRIAKVTTANNPTSTSQISLWNKKRSLAQQQQQQQLLLNSYSYRQAIDKEDDRDDNDGPMSCRTGNTNSEQPIADHHCAVSNPLHQRTDSADQKVDGRKSRSDWLTVRYRRRSTGCDETGLQHDTAQKQIAERKSIEETVAKEAMI